MPQITEYAPGMPSWIDLSTPDQAGAKAFYSELFGWTYTDNPISADDQSQFYSMAQIGEETAGGIFTLSNEMAEAGMPPCWQLYFTVAEVDASVARAVELGGSVLQEPFDVEPAPGMAVGRVAVIQDPGGAVACLWQPISHIGATVRQEHGTFEWVECLSSDQDATVKFYEDLFGASFMSMPGMEEGYYKVGMIDGQPAFGVMNIPPELAAQDVPPHWGLYFRVDDVDAAIAAATANGGKIANAAFDAPGIGRIGHILDPQGVSLGLMTPAAQ